MSASEPSVLPSGEVERFTATLAPLLRGLWWLRACAIFNAILGLFFVLTFIGIPFGAAAGWVAFLEWRAAERLGAARRDPGGQGLVLAEGAMRDLALHFIIQAVLVAIGILLAVLLLAVFAPLLGSLGSRLQMQ